MRQRLIAHPWGLASLAILGLLGAAAAWYLGSPLFIRTTVVEARPAGLTLPGATSSGISPSAPLDSTARSGPGADAMPIVGMGTFADRDQLHRGSGQAVLVRMGDGGHLLRLEDFAVTNGPDLHVLLSRAERPVTHEEVYNGVYVGKLKASQGAFHYELPPDTDLSGVRSVVVYCVPFRVIFTSAPLAAG